MKIKFNDISKMDLKQMDDRVRDMLTDVVRALSKHKITVIPVKNVMLMLGINSFEADMWSGAYLSIDDKGELDCHELPEEIDGFNDYDVISTTLH